MGQSSSGSSSSTTNTTSTTTNTIANAFNNALNTTQSYSNIGNTLPDNSGGSVINYILIAGAILAAMAMFFVLRKH